MTREQIEKERAISHEQAAGTALGESARSGEARSHNGLLALAWIAVAIPLLWGVWITVSKALVFFR